MQKVYHVMFSVPIEAGNITNKIRIGKKNMNLRKKKKLLVLLGMTALFCSACGKETKQTEVPEENLSHLSEDTYRIQADLTHNGTTEVIITSVYDVLQDAKEPAIVAVESHGKEIIWKKEAFLTDSSETAGEDSYFLCNVEGKSCLIHYNLDIKEDSAEYFYKVFYLGEDGSEITIAENSISFDTVWKQNMSFPVDEMVAFSKEVNEYMEKAYILVSTIDGELSYSTLDTMELYKENFQVFTGNENISTEDELRKSLNEYRMKLEEKNL